MERDAAMWRLRAWRGADARGARWTLGALLLAPLAAAGASYGAALAVLMLGGFFALASVTCRDLQRLGGVLPPRRTARGRRARDLRSFADFLALWMTFLSHLAAVAACARVLSATADHVTAGRARRWLFGYEARALGEPWPDALGVTVVLVVCAMFMCGLEESVLFTFLLMIILYVFSQFFAIFGLINLDIANIKMPIPITLYELIAAAAPVSYAFSAAPPPPPPQATATAPAPAAPASLRRHLLLSAALPAVALSTICFLYSNMLKGSSVDAAVPMTSLIEARAGAWACPALAAVSAAGVGLALTELCPPLFAALVALGSPEWKVLTRSMTYESATTGSPVLAVFTGGSLAAILAFACPLSHMLTLLNASHVLSVAVRALSAVVLRCVPTREQRDAGDVEYKRLAPARPRAERSRTTFWCLPSALRPTKTLESIKSKVSKDGEDRECLLLDEYDGERAAAADGGADEPGAAPSDDDSSGDDSTDIDAVVKEYRDTVQVTMLPPEPAAPVPPHSRGARLAAGGAALQLCGAAALAAALATERRSAWLGGVGGTVWVAGAWLSARQPAHAAGGAGAARGAAAGVRAAWRGARAPLTLLGALLLLTPLLIDSWPAILLFAGAGVVIYARCERWCGDLALAQARDERRARAPLPAAAAAGAVRLDAVYIAR